MRTVLTTLNAKYIHTSLALRLLYVANKNKHDISFSEFTLKEKDEAIVKHLLSLKADIIGFSVYIWNVTRIRTIVEQIKKENPNTIIILGGPEVSYESEFFISEWPVDYIISGEGEFVLDELLECLEKNEEVQHDSITSKKQRARTIAKADLEKIAQLESPYMLDCDKEEMKHKIIYFETSRGCPFQCQYCLSSLEKGVRYYPSDYLLQNLKFLIDNEVKVIKFLDRTFNINKEHTLRIFNFIIEHHRPNLSCQFEVYADILKPEMIEFLNQKLPENCFRFEIGIQSTYEPTNIAVKRRQNFNILASNIKKIIDGGKIDLHLDLIAGLPYETLERFIQSFNDVFALKGKEVQLGFLKMLRGTGLRKNASNFGYKYHEEAPYEIIYNDYISQAELQLIHDAEHMLEIYWNSGKFTLTMEHIFEHYYKGKYFEFFHELAQYYESNKMPTRKYQLEDIFRNLHQFLKMKGIDIFDDLRTDYYSNFKIRPQGFWEDKIEKKERKQLLYQIGNDKAFLKKYNVTRRIVEKQAAIDYLKEKNYLLTFFLINEKDEPYQMAVNYTFDV